MTLHRSVISAILLTLSIFAANAAAQKKSAPKKPPVKTTIPPLDVRTAREKVQIQHDNVNGFADKLTPIAQSIEVLEKAYIEKRMTPQQAAKHEATKEQFIAILRNTRNDLTALESEFRTKPALQKYLPNVKGVTDLALFAENEAVAGRFTASIKPLREIVIKLTDALAVIPK
ncbi:MAG TPA: hypothetical protein PKA82_02300 [Pyrinomonadaceae bacterium]|mgnify:CR=1 FL=1|nr:hypothetical protein [Pyrinomonadaceae bacterium]